MIGLREGWRRIKRASAVRSFETDLWRIANKLATAKQYCFLGKGFCAFCGMLEVTHADDCIIQDAKRVIATVEARSNG